MSNPCICAECDSKSTSCCALRSNDERSASTPISEIEAQCILKALPAIKRNDFLEDIQNRLLFEEQMLELFPNSNKVFYSPKAHCFQLKTKEGKCVFKGEDGCTLPVGVRPLFCMIYPFWFNEGKIRVFHDNNCLALLRGRKLNEVLGFFDATPEKLKEIYLKICSYWGVD